MSKIPIVVGVTSGSSCHNTTSGVFRLVYVIRHDVNLWAGRRQTVGRTDELALGGGLPPLLAQRLCQPQQFAISLVSVNYIFFSLVVFGVVFHRQLSCVCLVCWVSAPRRRAVKRVSR